MNFIKLKILNLPDDLSLADDYVRYKIMFYLIIIPGIIVTAVLGFYGFIEGEVFLGELDSSMTAVLVSLFLLARANKFLRVLIIILEILSFSFFLVLFTLGLARNQTFVWYYCFPVISFFFFGRNRGVFFSLLLMILSILVTVFREYVPIYSEYPEGFLFRFFISYSVVTILIFFFESTRQQTKEKLERTLEKLREETIRDGLTNLFNRRYLDSVVDLLFRQRDRGCRVGFIMADLDNFKQYNDTYGHHAGDEVLKSFGKILNESTRRKTDYAFRYGGEEFSVLLSSTSKEAAERIAADIITATESLNIPHRLSKYKKVTVSIGVSYFSSCPELTLDQMIKAADETLYDAKKAGRNCFRLKAFD